MILIHTQTCRRQNDHWLDRKTCLAELEGVLLASELEVATNEDEHPSGGA